MTDPRVSTSRRQEPHGIKSARPRAWVYLCDFIRNTRFMGHDVSNTSGRSLVARLVGAARGRRKEAHTIDEYDHRARVRGGHREARGPHRRLR